jgi:hypothetical protein
VVRRFGEKLCVEEGKKGIKSSKKCQKTAVFALVLPALYAGARQEHDQKRSDR